MKKFFSTFFVLVLLAFSVSACSILGAPVADKVAGVIDKYCEEPQGARELYRATINDELAIEGHSITVVCFGDTAPPDVTRLVPFEGGHAVAFAATDPPG